MPRVSALSSPAGSVPGAPPLARARLPLGVPALLVLAVVALVGLVHLPQPFTWDQAMFALGGRELHQGAVLYRDYWDTKQPGIYFFYLAGGALFGFSKEGIHLFELLWMLALGAALLLALRAAFERRRALLLVPLLTAGYYHAVTENWHLTQVESLVGLPLFLTLWWSLRGTEAKRGAGWRFLLSGLMGGVVLLFKLVLLPVVAAFWLADLLALATARRERRARAVLGAAAAMLAGAALPLALTVLWLAARGALDVALWTTFTFPAQALSEPRRFRVEYFVDGLSWFAKHFSPLVALAVIGGWSGLRPRRDPLTVRLLLWLTTGAFVILIQQWSYWQYQYMLFVVPLGILAARGLEALGPALSGLPLFRSRRESGLVLVALALALFAVPLGFLTLKTVFLARDRFALTARGRETHHFRMTRGGAYTKFVPEVRFLSEPGARSGPIFVVGNPLFYWLSGRRQAVPRSGGIMTAYLSTADWMRIAADLRAARPAYVFIQRDHQAILEGAAPRAAPLLALIASEYRPERSGPLGTWYALAASEPAAR